MKSIKYIKRIEVRANLRRWYAIAEYYKKSIECYTINIKINQTGNIKQITVYYSNVFENKSFRQTRKDFYHIFYQVANIITKNRRPNDIIALNNGRWGTKSSFTKIKIKNETLQ